MLSCHTLLLLAVPLCLSAANSIASAETHAFVEAAVESARREATKRNQKLHLTDKVTYHAYEEMYGRFLMPLRMKRGGRIKMLEIGLGCDSAYGPGSSAQLWQMLLPHAERWEAEIDARCVEKAASKLNRAGVHPLVGDQSNETTVRQWVKASGGNFDLIIDDGGHSNHMIYNSLKVLWPQLRPGGIYIIEDLHVGRARAKPSHAPVIADVLHAWNEQLITSVHSRKMAAELKKRRSPKKGIPESMHVEMLVERHPMPRDVGFVFVQLEAAVIGKLGSGGQLARELHDTMTESVNGRADADKVQRIIAAYKRDAADDE